MVSLLIVMEYIFESDDRALLSHVTNLTMLCFLTKIYMFLCSIICKLNTKKKQNEESTSKGQLIYSVLICLGLWGVTP
jgi:hypothetical protein